MKAYKIKVSSDEGTTIGVKMMTEEQYAFTKELFTDLTENRSPNVSFLIDGESVEFKIKECPEEEYKMTEHGVEYVGESFGF